MSGEKYGNAIGQYYYGLLVNLELDGNMEIKEKLQFLMTTDATKLTTEQEKEQKRV